MGSMVSNVEVVTDYTMDQSVVRLHIDLVISHRQRDEIRDLMDHGMYPAAQDKLCEILGSRYVGVISLFFADMMSKIGQQQLTEAA